MFFALPFRQKNQQETQSSSMRKRSLLPPLTSEQKELLLTKGNKVDTSHHLYAPATLGNVPTLIYAESLTDTVSDTLSDYGPEDNLQSNTARSTGPSASDIPSEIFFMHNSKELEELRRQATRRRERNTHNSRHREVKMGRAQNNRNKDSRRFHGDEYFVKERKRIEAALRKNIGKDLLWSPTTMMMNEPSVNYLESLFSRLWVTK